MTESNALIAAAALLHQIDIGDFTDSLGHSAKMLKAVGDLRAALASRASTPVGEAPAGYWLAPMEPDTAMIRAGFYFETDENVRRFWYALRDHWLARNIALTAGVGEAK